ncbi:MAG: hypothetical protein AVO33_05025 [delta proteobacterium ML8_F1]|nr:MAG: hypothetical protein AVO33_05025 [delta proteobacterium ML8_F1]
MNTQIVFTLNDLGKFALWAALIIVLIYIIFILRRIFMSLRDINKVLEDNRDHIDEILKTAPGITKNFDSLSKNLAKDVAAFNGTVENLANITEKMTNVKHIKERFSKEEKKDKPVETNSKEID